MTSITQLNYGLTTVIDEHFRTTDVQECAENLLYTNAHSLMSWAFFTTFDWSTRLMS